MRQLARERRSIQCIDVSRAAADALLVRTRTELHRRLSPSSLLTASSYFADCRLQWLHTLRDISDEGPRCLAVLFALRELGVQLIAQALLLDSPLAQRLYHIT